MATKTLYNSPTVNPFAFLQEEGQVDAQQTGAAQRGAPKKDAAAAVESPAQRAERRLQANAEKAKEQEAAKQKEQADRALQALVGPLDDFVQQKGPKKSERERNEKKLKSREEFDKASTGGKPYQQDGERQPRKDGEKRPYTPKEFTGQKKQVDRRDGAQGHFNEKKDRDGQIKKAGYQGHQGQTSQGGQRRGREFDKHSAGKTSNKPEDKRHGEGAGNWGSPLDAAVVEESLTDATTAASGWGDEGENNKPTTPVHDDEKKTGDDAETPKEKREEKASWDDEGFGKMTLKEFQDKVAAEKAAQLTKAVGTVQPRERDLKGVDLSKFVEKDNQDDEKYAKKAKKETKKPVAAARVGEKPVNLAEIFSVGGRPRQDRPQGDRPQGDRPPRSQGDRPQGDRPPRGDKPQGDRPPRTQGDRPQRDGQSGEHKPRGGQQRGEYVQAHKVPTREKDFPGLPTRQ